jgi:hypothetical protein
VASKIDRRDMDRNDKLYGLWREQGGACFYCDGPTFVPDREAKDSARRRLRIEVGVSGAGKHLNQHVATIDSATKAMACKFCNCSREGKSPVAHRKAVQAIVAADRHPVNRLIEAYADGRLSWRLIGNS